MGLASNSAFSVINSQGDLLLGFLERFLSLIGLHSDETHAVFNLFMWTIFQPYDPVLHNLEIFAVT